MSTKQGTTGYAEPRKARTHGNPVMTQRFGADPYAMVYKDRVYLYMTGDLLTNDEAGKLTENVYSAIRTISVASSADLVNWTDHGEVHAAGEDGIATWGGNSWAPAAAWKTIDGRDRFFLYFANSGNGIAVLEGDSPTGPFRDPIGGPLVSRDTPTCAEVTWLFDPAVLVDEDGTGYLYFGGGIPSPDKTSDPGTARVAKLSDDMIHLDGDPVPIAHVPYLFEDSGINRIGDRYFYSYCSNFNVTPEDGAKLGFSSGEIITMEGKDPMGPFTLRGPVLANPEAFFGRGGNNHHCMFRFGNQWYIAYHARLLEEGMGLTGGYRSTNIDVLPIDSSGYPVRATGTRQGVKAVCPLDPYREVPAATMAVMAGIGTVSAQPDVLPGQAGEMLVHPQETGSWLCVKGVDFGEKGAASISVTARVAGEGTLRIACDDLSADTLAEINLQDTAGAFREIRVSLSGPVKGLRDLYLLPEGEGVYLRSWQFHESR